MAQEKNANVNLMLSITEALRNQLVVLAAQRSIKDPQSRISVSGLVREILCEYLETLEQKRSEKCHGKLGA